MNLLTLESLGTAARIGAVSAALAAVGVLIAMYFLKLKRQRREISSTFLWKRSVEDLRANSPFQRLRRNLLLFLQLLILIAALLSLGRPALMPSAREGVTYVCLVDTSASMKATDVDPNRLSVALARVKSIIDDMTPSDQMMIIGFGAHPHVSATLTADKSALYTAIRGMEAGDTSTNIVEAFELADSLTRTLPGARFVLVSDGAFGQGTTIPSISAPLQYISVGKGGRNVGVTAIDVRRTVEDPAVGEIFAKVTNFDEEPATVNMSLTLDGVLRDASAVTVAPGSSQASVFKVSLDAERIAEVSIDSADDLDVDNRAWTILEPARKVRAIVVGEANTFLTTALASAAGVEVSRADSADLAPPSENENPVYIYDGKAPSSLVRAGYLVFDAVVPSEGFKQTGEVKNPVILDVDTSHPITSFLDLGDIYVDKARKMKFPPETKVLVTSDETPLVALSYVGPARVLTVTFDPIESRWPLRVSYPMFVANAVNFLSSGGRLATSRQFFAGEALVLQTEPGVSEISIVDPDNRASTVACEPDRPVSFGKTLRAGIYTVHFSDTKIPYAANLTNVVESDIRPVSEFQAGSSKVTGVAVASPKNREIWRELLILAFVVLMIEWYIYNRRVYV